MALGRLLGSYGFGEAFGVLYGFGGGPLWVWEGFWGPLWVWGAFGGPLWVWGALGFNRMKGGFWSCFSMGLGDPLVQLLGRFGIFFPMGL